MFARCQTRSAHRAFLPGGAIISLVATFTLAATAYGQTQTPPSPEQGNADPSAASSPHQRATTSESATESPATSSPEAAGASTPHQQEVLKGSEGMTGQATTATQFVQTAAQDGMAEVALGKLAAKKSSNSAVKAFGERMVSDHGKANAELAALGQRKNLSVPKELDAKHRAMVDELSGKSGAAFDASYAQHMAGDHAKAVALFTQASKLSDADLAGFAKKTLPTLQEHKRMADDLSRTHTAAAPSQ